jgi:hypothetical protein
MKKIIIIVFLLVKLSVSYSQHSLKGIIRDRENNEALAGASVIVEGSSKVLASDKKGFFVISDISAGQQLVTIRFTGYHKKNR